MASVSQLAPIHLSLDVHKEHHLGRDLARLALAEAQQRYDDVIGDFPV